MQPYSADWWLQISVLPGLQSVSFILVFLTVWFSPFERTPSRSVKYVPSWEEGFRDKAHFGPKLYVRSRRVTAIKE